MYPVEPKPPKKQLACLTSIQDMEDVHVQNVTGHCIKAMTSDPYGHPVFAVIDVKVGSILVYDSEDQQILRKIGAGYHEVEWVTFDEQNHFVIVTNKPAAAGGENSIIKYNLKGELVSTCNIEDASKIYAVACMSDSRLGVSLMLGTHEQVVRVYDHSAQSLLTTISKNSEGKPYFIKPQYMVATGDRLVVGDVATKNLRCFTTTSTDNPNQLLWTYPMDMPRGMCVDGGGNICACDFRNNRVTLLTPDGELIGHSLTGLSKPQYVAMNHNKLFTIDMGRSTSYRLSVYNLFKTTRARRHSKGKPEWQK